MKTVLMENSWLRRGAFPGMDYGWGNGYVILPPGHPLFGQSYDFAGHFVDAHGGLTYANMISENHLEAWGLDPSLVGHWAFGFDTAHYGDNLHRWPKEA